MTTDDPIVTGLLQELAREDQVLMGAARDLEGARRKFEVLSRKYAAIRDVVASQLAGSPYKVPVIWETDGVHQVGFVSEGRYRFIHMATGDAVVAALKESEEPMTLEQIVDALRGGGALREARSPRAVNAALMRTTGIEKLEGGRYRYVEELEPEDVPLE